MNTTKDYVLLGTGTLSMLVACTDPLVGDWELTDFPPYGLSFENSYSGYDSACGNYVWEAQYTIAGELTVDDEMGAEFVLEVESTYSSTSDLCGTYSDDDGFRVDYEGPAEQTDKREYEMTLDGGTDGTLQLTCTLSDDENQLECTSEDDADYNLVFGRKGG